MWFRKLGLDMDIVENFTDVTEVYQKQKAFLEKFEAYRQIHLNEGGSPSRAEDIHFRHLFEDAYPTPSHYIDSVFAEAVNYAKDFDLPGPQIPASKILDVKQNVVAGMGDSFFLRLMYLQNLARNAMNELEEQLVIPLPKTLPDLKLITASDIFHALRVEGSKVMAPKKNDDAAPPKRSLLPSLLKGSYQKATDSPSIETGFVMDVTTPALISGKHIKIATVAIQEPGTSHTKRVEICIDGSLKDQVKIGDLIGASGLQNAPKPNEYMVAQTVAMLVPVSIGSFLRKAEPDFSHIPSTVRDLVRVSADPDDHRMKYGDVLTDEHSGSIIFARVMDWDERARTITIKDKDNQTLTVRSKESVQSLKLEKNMTFLATPIKLDDDGIYTISSLHTHQLEAPYGGRLLSGLRTISSHGPSANVTNDIHEQDTIPVLTQPMLT